MPFLRKFNLKVGLGLAAGVLALTLGISFFSFKKEVEEFEQRTEIIKKDAEEFKGLNDEEKFKETWVVLVPVVKSSVESGSILHADALLMIHSLIRIACKTECAALVVKMREKRREHLVQKNLAEYTKSLLSETLMIQERVDECL